MVRRPWGFHVVMFYFLVLAVVAPLCHGETGRRHALRHSHLVASRSVADVKQLIEEVNKQRDTYELRCAASTEAIEANQKSLQASLDRAERSLQASAVAEMQLKTQQGTLYAKAVSINHHRDHVQWLCRRLADDGQSEAEVLRKSDELANKVIGITSKMKGDQSAKAAQLQGSLYDQKARLVQAGKACDSEVSAAELELNATNEGIKDYDRQLQALEGRREKTNSTRGNFSQSVLQLQLLQKMVNSECKSNITGTSQRLEELQRQRAAGGTTSATDCEVSEWRHGDCSKDCKGGTKTLKREVVRQAAGGGAACPELEATMACNVQKCGVKCEIGSWSEWTQCSRQCGGGYRTRKRSVVAAEEAPAEAAVAAPAPAAAVSGASNNSEPPASMVVAPVDKVQESSASAALAMFDNDEAAACGLTRDVESCNTQQCGAMCKVGEWGAWGPCTKGCGSGKRARRRNKAVAEHAPLGTTCEGFESDFATCKTDECPSSGTLSCKARQDIVIMVDSSELVEAGDFQAQKSFVKGLLGQFVLNRAKHAVAGLVLFGSAVPGVLPLTDSMEALAARIDNAVQSKGAQSLDVGLEAARNQSYGWSARQDAPKTVLLLLQGKPDSAVKALEETQYLKDQGARVVLIVIDKDGGCALNKHMLEQIASEPPADNVFYFKSFQELGSKTKEQVVNLCPSLEGGEALPIQYLPIPAQ